MHSTRAPDYGYFNHTNGQQASYQQIDPSGAGPSSSQAWAPAPSTIQSTQPAAAFASSNDSPFSNPPDDPPTYSGHGSAPLEAHWQPLVAPGLPETPYEDPVSEPGLEPCSQFLWGFRKLRIAIPTIEGIELPHLFDCKQIPPPQKRCPDPSCQYLKELEGQRLMRKQSCGGGSGCPRGDGAASGSGDKEPLFFDYYVCARPSEASQLCRIFCVQCAAKVPPSQLANYHSEECVREFRKYVLANCKCDPSLNPMELQIPPNPTCPMNLNCYKHRKNLYPIQNIHNYMLDCLHNRRRYVEPTSN